MKKTQNASPSRSRLNSDRPKPRVRVKFNSESSSKPRPQNQVPLKSRKLAPAGTTQSSSEEKKFTIYVGNLNYRRTEQGLADLFRKYGKVTNVSMVKRPNSDLKMGIAFVEMCDEGEAFRAIKGLNGALVDGRNLKVGQANEFGQAPKKKIQFTPKKRARDAS